MPEPDEPPPADVADQSAAGFLRERHGGVVHSRGRRSSFIALLTVAAVVVALPRLGVAPPATAVFAGIAAGTSGLGWLLGSTDLGFRAVFWIAPPLLMAGMFWLADSSPAIAAASGIVAAVAAAALLLGMIRFPLGMLIMSAMAGLFWGVTGQISAVSHGLVGIDHPHPPLWMVVPVSTAAYSAVLMNWLLPLWSAMCGALVSSYRIVDQVSRPLLLSIPTIAAAGAAAISPLAVSLAAVVAMLVAGRHLLYLGDAT